MSDEVEGLEVFGKLINENRFDLCKLVYIIFPFGQKGTELANMAPYDWQMEEWRKLSDHLKNPETRYETYRLVISSGNGSAKTAFGAMTAIMLLYTHRLKSRVTANTDPQLSQIVWPEYDKWFHQARYVGHFFEKLGTSIKAKKKELEEVWRLDRFTWSEQNPTAISGLHNKGHAVLYIFEEAPGIPAKIWQYASGAFTETETIKIHMGFGNSDDPESKFEQNMTSPIWNSRRIDTRTLSHIDPKQIEAWLMEAGGDEDDDDFRVRVRGLPRKSAKDSIIKLEDVEAALEKRKTFDKASVHNFPVVLSCDPAWTGGDDCAIWYKQGNYKCLLEVYKLKKQSGETHQLTYNKLSYWERKLNADAVHLDQAEGTGIFTLAMNAGKYHWVLVHFNGSPTDHVDSKESEFGNIRAMMYYHLRDDIKNGGVLDSREEKWIEDIKKQLCWTKGTRHKVTHKKMAEPKVDVKDRVGKSPDVADGAVLLFAYDVQEKLPSNEDMHEDIQGGSGAIQMADHNVDYGDDDGNFYD